MKEWNMPELMELNVMMTLSGTNENKTEAQLQLKYEGQAPNLYPGEWAEALKS